MYQASTGSPNLMLLGNRAPRAIRNTRSPTSAFILIWFVTPPPFPCPPARTKRTSDGGPAHACHRPGFPPTSSRSPRAPECASVALRHGRPAARSAGPAAGSPASSENHSSVTRSQVHLPTLRPIQRHSERSSAGTCRATVNASAWPMHSYRLVSSVPPSPPSPVCSRTARYAHRLVASNVSTFRPTPITRSCR